MNKALKGLLALLLVIILLEIIYYLSISQFSNYITLHSCKFTPGQFITDQNATCDMQVVPLQTGGSTLFLKSPLKNLKIQKGVVYGVVSIPLAVGLKMPFNIQLGSAKDSIYVCEYTGKFNVPIQCSQQTFNTVVNKITDKVTLLQFSPSTILQGEKCSYINNTLIQIFSGEKGFFSLLSILMNSKCKPVASQLYIQ